MAMADRALGKITNPGGTERLHEYWVHGEGAAKIRWGTPGDFDRCVLHLGKFIRDPQGYCNLAHHAATGMYPAQHAAEIRKATGRSQVTTPDYDADGLDSSWDDDQSDLPDLTGLDVDHFEAAAKEMGLAAPDEPAQRAVPKLGTGARFAKLKSSLAAKGARNPGALAAYIGRKKFGKGKFTKLAAKARGKGSHRMDEALPFVRSFPLQDISIRAGGDGRTVDAYATVFDTPAPIHDQDGDYIEVIDRRAFDRILTKIGPAGGRSNWRCGVFYNHGMTLHGTPSDRNSLPIGVPLEIRADDHGLFTRTRYHKGELADQILEAIREGSLSAYSFSGRFDRSAPRPPRGGFRPDRTGNLATVRRTESTLREYGPTPFPAYQDAAVVGVRSEQIVAQLDHIAELLRSGAPLDSPQDEFSGAPEWDSPSEDSRLVARSGRPVKEQFRANAADFLQRYGDRHDRSSGPAG
jgi:HK97 family phage prohead protease